MNLLVFMPRIVRTVYVQSFSLRQRCVSKEFGSLSSSKSKVCVLQSSLSNSRPSPHLRFIYDPYPLHLHRSSTLTYCVCYSHTLTPRQAHAFLCPAVFSLSSYVCWGRHTNWMITEELIPLLSPQKPTLCNTRAVAHSLLVLWRKAGPEVGLSAQLCST